MTLRIAATGLAAFALGLSGLALAAGPGGQGNQSAHGSHGDHAGHGQGQGTAGQGKAMKPKAAQAATGGNRYNGLPCPPGLAKKSPRCVPPGQWKKGDRLPESWAGHYTGYESLPQVFRDRYANRADRRYVHQEGKVFVVDAASRAVVDVLTR